MRANARAVWTWRPLDELSQDIRFAWRTLFKHRAVAGFAIVSLALGIGANTAIYSFSVGIRVARTRSEVPMTTELEVNKSRPELLFELVKGWVTGTEPELGEMHTINQAPRS